MCHPQLKDLAGPYKAFARVYYNNLTRDQLKAECLDYGLPVSGPKYKIVDRLQRHANSKQFGQETQLAAKNDAGSPSPPALQPKDALKVRRALVADLRRGLVWDKKFKRGGAKILKAQYAGCSKQLFTELFPHSAGKEKVALDLERDLQVGHLGRMLRYGGSLELQPGSLSAKFDAAVNTVTVSGKYTMM